MARLLAALGSDAAAAIEAGEIEPVPIPRLLMYLWGSWAGVISLHLRVDEFKAEDFSVRDSLGLGAQILVRGLGGTLPESPPAAE